MAEQRNREGQRFGNYRLERLLGRGGFAEVYLGHHLRLERQAAIKILHAYLSEQEIDAFQREAQIIAALDHPHIVRILDFDVQNGVPFLVMDYLPNGTLRQRHNRGERVPLPTVVSYVKQVAETLHYAHEQRLIHRDVKPENMLIGRRHEVVLSDFGIAAIAHSTSSMTAQASVGTIPYMAPEQIQAHPRAASDQYALGVVVYEWLSGELPFVGSFTEIFAKHLMTPPPPLRQKVPTVSGEVEQVVLTALAKEPRQRFGSVQAFAIALEQACHAAGSQPTVYAQEETVRGDSGIQAKSSVLSETPAKDTDPSRRGTGPTSAPTIEPPITPLKSTVPPTVPAFPSTDPKAGELPPTIPVEPHPSPPDAAKSSAGQVEVASPPPPPPAKPGLGRLLLVALAIIVIIASIAGFGAYQNHVNQVNTQATADANDATVMASDATSTAQAIAGATSTAQAIAGATATIVAQNPYPSYLSGSGTLALYDPLSSSSSWSSSSDSSFGGACQFSNGALHISQAPPRKLYRCAGPSTSFSDFAFEVQMNIITGDCGGIVFREGSGGKFYTFVVCGIVYRLFLYVDYTGTNTRDLTAPQDQSVLALPDGRIHTIAVLASGSTIKLYVNQENIASVNDSTYSAGTIGLIAQANDTQTEVVYTNARVWTL